ncbi:hypothetical protein [Actinomadura miaoliensis]|uniref:Transposase n=1 Tax=Actinomadura miaoliensis TaxID=430685 RepID=A0ABP7VM77_9ACTN
MGLAKIQRNSAGWVVAQARMARQVASSRSAGEPVARAVCMVAVSSSEWDSQGSGLLIPADRHRLTPLFWQHVRPYGEVGLDMGSRLEIGGTDLGGLG